MNKRMVLSAFADEYADNLIEQCQELNNLGISYMEMRGVNGKNVSVLSKTEVREAKKVLADYGVKVSSIGSPLGKLKLDSDLVGHLETAKRVFETANELDAKNIRIFSFYLPDGKTREECKGQVFDELEKIVKLSEEYGLTLCHENEALIYGESPEKCVELLEYFGSRMKAVLDMGNFVLDGYNPWEAYKLLRKHIEYFHIKDALYAGAIVPAGKGEAQIKRILDDYKVNGEKDTFITLEPHLQTFSGLNALVGKTFDNPYKYENQQVAFADAVSKLKELL
ncbi:MAG: sugar phosphate isomerase/epimerase [Clostridia bacterium]|nr:sugar phosphate isomerase/epimerase [Clostridia bacterium]